MIFLDLWVSNPQLFSSRQEYLAERALRRAGAGAWTFRGSSWRGRAQRSSGCGPCLYRGKMKGSIMVMVLWESYDHDDIIIDIIWYVLYLLYDDIQFLGVRSSQAEDSSWGNKAVCCFTDRIFKVTARVGSSLNRQLRYLSANRWTILSADAWSKRGRSTSTGTCGWPTLPSSTCSIWQSSWIARLTSTFRNATRMDTMRQVLSQRAEPLPQVATLRRLCNVAWWNLPMRRSVQADCSALVYWVEIHQNMWGRSHF